jgi:hypothetical protein
VTKLDTRDARCDLTSRECCKLISAALAGALGTGLPLRAVRSLITIAHNAAAGDVNVSQLEHAVLELNGLGPEDAVRLSAVSRMLGAVVAGVSEQAVPGNVDIALTWIYEQGDNFWEAMAQGIRSVQQAQS